jgi:hypothetical protein
MPSAWQAQYSYCHVYIHVSRAACAHSSLPGEAFALQKLKLDERVVLRLLQNGGVDDEVTWPRGGTPLINEGVCLNIQARKGLLFQYIYFYLLNILVQLFNISNKL